MTCVIFMVASSTTTQKLYVGHPSDLIMIRSSSCALSKTTLPLTWSSTTVSPWRGTLKRIADCFPGTGPLISLHLPSYLGMLFSDVHPLCLAVWSLVPVKTEPLHPLDDCLYGLVSRTGLVCVFDAQDEDTFVVTGEQPVKQGCPDAAYMEVAGRARCKSYADVVSHREMIISQIEQKFIDDICEGLVYGILQDAGAE